MGLVSRIKHDRQKKQKRDEIKNRHPKSVISRMPGQIHDFQHIKKIAGQQRDKPFRLDKKRKSGGKNESRQPPNDECQRRRAEVRDAGRGGLGEPLQLALQSPGIHAESDRIFPDVIADRDPRLHKFSPQIQILDDFRSDAGVSADFLIIRPGDEDTGSVEPFFRIVSFERRRKNEDG